MRMVKVDTVTCNFVWGMVLIAFLPNRAADVLASYPERRGCEATDVHEIRYGCSSK